MILIVLICIEIHTILIIIPKFNFLNLYYENIRQERIKISHTLLNLIRISLTLLKALNIIVSTA